MKRKLWAAKGWVKNVPLRSSVLGALAWLIAGCGASGPALREPDPYGPRVADCISMPRPLADTLQAQMVPIDAGTAVLGSTEPERVQARRDFGPGGQQLFRNERPLRRAHLPGFRIDRAPLTNAAYRELVEACGTPPPNAELLTEATWAGLQRAFKLTRAYALVQLFLWDDHDPPADHLKHPAVLVTHDDASMYCAWRGARLPTADEWERAARGPEGRIYPWGNSYDPFRVNSVARKAHDTLPVGSLPSGASAEGILDLGGNVFEWTSSPALGQPDAAVVKGNGWDGRGGYGRGAAWLAQPRALRDVNLGFRCAADLI